MAFHQTKKCKICDCVFVMNSPHHNYCSDECRRKGKNANERNRKNKAKVKVKPSSASASIEDVVRFAEDFRKKHGRYIHYGEAVLLMERRKDNE